MATDGQEVGGASSLMQSFTRGTLTLITSKDPPSTQITSKDLQQIKPGEAFQERAPVREETASVLTRRPECLGVALLS